MGSEFDETTARWGSFVIEGPGNKGFIELAQRSRTSFELQSTITYFGVTGLEEIDRIPPSSLEAIRRVTPEQLPETDLASVPIVLRWFVSPYGVHTPASLIHDRLIDADPPIEGLTDVDADRYLRFMLADLGVRFIRRWLMWAATSFRTRLVGGTIRKVLLLIWLVAAAVGSVALVVALATGRWWLVAAAVLAPLPGGLLWGRQWGAGVVGAYFGVPWLLPPVAFAGLVYWLYQAGEYVVGKIIGEQRSGTEPTDYRFF